MRNWSRPGGHSRVARSHAVCLAACSLAALPLAVQAQAEARFPAAGDARSILQWLTANTSMNPAKVILAGPGSVVAVTRADPPGAIRTALLRAEVIDPNLAVAGGYLSWAGEIEIDCQAPRYRYMELLRFPERDLLDIPKGAPSGEWSRPAPSSDEGRIVSALCDDRFRGPYGFPVAAGKAGPAVTPSDLPPQTPPAPTPEAAPSPMPRRSAVADGDFTVQVASVSDREQALRLLRNLLEGPLRARGLTSSVRQTAVDGRVFYRALLSGFASRTDAAAVCADLKGQGVDCFVRPAR